MAPLQLLLLVSLPFVAIFAMLNLTLGLYLLAGIELAMLFTLLALYFWSRKQATTPLLVNLYILHPALLFALLFPQGGFSEIGFIWSFGFPFIACLAGGSRFGMAWTLAYAVVVSVIGADAMAMEWQRQLYIALGYAAFSMIAIYTACYREQLEAASSQQRIEHAYQEGPADTHMSQRALLDSLPMPVGIYADGRWKYCNRAAAMLLGWGAPELLVGRRVADDIESADQEAFSTMNHTIAERGMPSRQSAMHLFSHDRTPVEVTWHAAPVVLEGGAAVLVVMERPQQVRKQQSGRDSRLEHSQRLESLGVLAGGIAHDFNNLLAAIMGNAELAQRKITGNTEAARDHLVNIVNSCDHAAELCRQMLSYAGKGSYTIEVLDINEMVRSMGRLIRASVGSHISMKIKLDQYLSGIEADRAQIQQVLLNFIVNSAEAIGSDPGEVKISTGMRQMVREELDQLYNGASLEPGAYVVIEVRDTGCGMDEETRGRIFDPFYTTKATGSGLGLSAVLGIVRGHHGGIHLVSEPGKGTVFRVFFPAATRVAESQMLATVEVQAWHGCGKVLVVDDDPGVCSAAASLIEDMGFEPVTAADGREGVEAFNQHLGGLVDVLMDMTMPVMSGADAMTEMRRIDASVPILLVSGYSEVEAGKLLSGNRPDGFLQKPFKSNDLRRLLHEVTHAG